MPLPSTNISALTDAGPYDVKDKLQFQRNVLGTWQDFHTDVETYFGPIKTATFDWDGTDAWSDNLNTTGMVIPIEVFGTFTPGNAPTAQSVQVQIAYVGPGGVGALLAEYPDTAEGQAVSFGFISPGMTTGVGGMQILVGILGVSPFSGTTRFTILYVEKDPI